MVREEIEQLSVEHVTEGGTTEVANCYSMLINYIKRRLTLGLRRV